ncbi:hypothetical protein BDV96DRAFT_639252 [Lophiotrema nucula]|uniref:Uncharacterized protein n=1 Tax=Lophiotrema nucula TaxID=690887 RepID=A0A6A5ZSN7_9PLEO|nr:hypothetical protein BDV96DRAFT_639252 [Lophiotrema nucula]
MDYYLVRDLAEGFLHSTSFALGTGIGLSYAFNIRPDDVRRKLFGPRPSEVQLEVPGFETAKVFSAPRDKTSPFAVRYEALQEEHAQVIEVKKSQVIQEPGKQHAHTLLDGFEFRQDQSPRPSDFGQVLDAYELHVKAEQAWKLAMDAVVSGSVRLGWILLVLSLIQMYSLVRRFIYWLKDLKQTVARQDERIADQDAAIARQEDRITAQNRTIATQDDRIAEQGRTIASQDEKIANLQQPTETAPDDNHDNRDSLPQEIRTDLDRVQTENTSLKDDVQSLLTTRFTSHLKSLGDNIRISALETSQNGSVARLSALETSQQASDGRVQSLEMAKRTADIARRQFAFTLWTTYLPSQQANDTWTQAKQNIVPWEMNIQSPNYKRPITVDDFTADDFDRLALAFFGQLIRIVYQQATAIDMFSRAQPRRGY